MLTLLISVFSIGLLLEQLEKGWKLPYVKSWPVRVIGLNLIQVGVILLAGMTWQKWMGSRSLFHCGENFSPVVGAGLAYFISTFVFYWWHRLRHESPLMWRWFHQVHHSPRRIELMTAFYKHPAEMVANSIIGSLLAFFIFGLSQEGGAIYVMLTVSVELFYHVNIKTPRWIGYVIQRPEMHRLHHQQDRHKNNYGDITWWDMLFGTYENPETFEKICGFRPKREERLGEMIRFKDVHK